MEVMRVLDIQPTYKELKPVWVPSSNLFVIYIQPTYKELKQPIKCSTTCSIEYIQPTYKELKHIFYLFRLNSHFVCCNIGLPGIAE